MTDLLRKIRLSAEHHGVEGKHPLLVMGVSRCVRDAYLCGLAFAAYANDADISDVERRRLDLVGASLGMSEDDVGSIVGQVLSNSDALKLAIFREVLSVLDCDQSRKMFLKEFRHIWQLQRKANAELQGWTANIAEMFWGSKHQKQVVFDSFTEEEKQYFSRIENPISGVRSYIVHQEAPVRQIYNEDELYSEFSKFADGIGFGDEISESRLDEIRSALNAEVVARCQTCRFRVVDMWRRIAISFEFLCDDILCLAKYDTKEYKRKAVTRYTKMLLCLCAYVGVRDSLDLNILNGFLKAFNWHDSEDWYQYANNRLGKFENAMPRAFWLREVESRICYLLKVPQYNKWFTYSLDDCLKYDKKFLKIT